MKYRILFFAGFLIYPVISWEYTILYHYLGSSRIFEQAASILTCISIFSSVALFHTAVDRVISGLLLSKEISVLEQSRKLQDQQDREIRYLKTVSEKEQAHFFSSLEVLADLIHTSPEQAVLYARRLTEIPPDMETTRFCSDSFIDLILRTKRAEAKTCGIRTEYRISLPPAENNSVITYPEMSSLFFNLLDNGLESCRHSGAPSPFLRLELSWQGEILRIHMVNSKNPVVKFNGTTTKSERPLHGFGLKIIEQIAEEHLGYCVWRNDGDRFDSLVILNYTQSAKTNNRGD